MAGSRSGQQRASVVDNVEDWMSRRNTDLQRLGRNADAVGRDLWQWSTRTGQNLAAARPSDVTALGAEFLAKPKPTQSGPIPRRAPPPQHGATQRTGRAARDVLNYGAKVAAGDAARVAGNVVGAGRGASNTIKDAWDGAKFVGRLANPVEAATAPLGETAWDQLFQAGNRGLNYAVERISNPSATGRDMGQGLRKLQIELDPSATPMSDTIVGEMGRNFEIGKNQGELGFDVGSVAYGGAIAKELGGLGALSKEQRVAKALGRGVKPKAAEYLAKEYEGRGHHVIPKRWRTPEKVAGLPLPDAISGKPAPKWLSESPFFLLKPKGMGQDEFYALHHGVDLFSNVNRLPASVGGGVWNGKAMGLKKFGPVERAWYGSPAPLKAAVGGAAVGAAGLTYDLLSGEGRQ